MYKKKYNSFIKRNTFTVSLTLSEDIKLSDLSIFSLLFGSYSNDIYNDMFNFKSPLDMPQYLPNFKLDAGITEVSNKKTGNKEKRFYFAIDLTKLEEQDKVENIIKAIKKVFSLPSVDESFKYFINNVQSLVEMSRTQSEYTKLLNSIVRKSLYNDVEYTNGSMSSIALDLAAENGEDYVFNAFEKIRTSLLENIVEVKFVSDRTDSDYDEVEEIILKTFKENPSLKPWEIKYNVGTLDSEYNIEKSTSNSMIFYKFENKEEDLYSSTLTKMYFSEVIYKFYLNEIRLKHNLIYSPIISLTDDYYYTNNEVQNQNLDTIITLENEFFSKIKDSLDESILDNIAAGMKKEALRLYEGKSWEGMRAYLFRFGIDASELNSEELYDKIFDLALNLDKNKIDLNNFNIINKTKIVGA